MTRHAPNADRSGAAMLALGGLATIGAAAWLNHRRHSRYDLHGRTVLITGGVRGLGLLLAREFGRRGASLIIVSRTPADIARAEDELRATGHEVTAECVETEEQFRALVGMGCNTFQGYLFSTPLTLADIDARLAAPLPRVA